jgi:excisionase family DNA binding protein
LSNEQSEGEDVVPILMTTEELAELLRVSTRVVHQWRQRGKIPAIRLPGRGYRFKREHIEALLNAGETERDAA